MTVYLLFSISILSEVHGFGTLSVVHGEFFFYCVILLAVEQGCLVLFKCWLSGGMLVMCISSWNRTRGLCLVF